MSDLKKCLCGNNDLGYNIIQLEDEKHGHQIVWCRKCGRASEGDSIKQAEMRFCSNEDALQAQLEELQGKYNKLMENHNTTNMDVAHYLSEIAVYKGDLDDMKRRLKEGIARIDKQIKASPDDNEEQYRWGLMDAKHFWAMNSPNLRTNDIR